MSHNNSRSEGNINNQNDREWSEIIVDLLDDIYPLLDLKYAELKDIEETIQKEADPLKRKRYLITDILGRVFNAVPIKVVGTQVLFRLPFKPDQEGYEWWGPNSLDPTIYVSLSLDEHKEDKYVVPKQLLSVVEPLRLAAAIPEGDEDPGTSQVINLQGDKFGRLVFEPLDIYPFNTGGNEDLYFLYEDPEKLDFDELPEELADILAEVLPDIEYDEVEGQGQGQEQEQENFDNQLGGEDVDERVSIMTEIKSKEVTGKLLSNENKKDSRNLSAASPRDLRGSTAAVPTSIPTSIPTSSVQASPISQVASVTSTSKTQAIAENSTDMRDSKDKKVKPIIVLKEKEKPIILLKEKEKEQEKEKEKEKEQEKEKEKEKEQEKEKEKEKEKEQEEKEKEKEQEKEKATFVSNMPNTVQSMSSGSQSEHMPKVQSETDLSAKDVLEKDVSEPEKEGILEGEKLIVQSKDVQKDLSVPEKVLEGDLLEKDLPKKEVVIDFEKVEKPIPLEVKEMEQIQTFDPEPLPEEDLEQIVFVPSKPREKLEDYRGYKDPSAMSLYSQQDHQDHKDHQEEAEPKISDELREKIELREGLADGPNPSKRYIFYPTQIRGYEWLNDNSPFPIRIKDRSFPTVEHYIQFMKFFSGLSKEERNNKKLLQETYDNIIKATPTQARQMTSATGTLRPKMTNFKDQEWNKQKNKIVYYGRIHKILSNPNLRERLMRLKPYNINHKVVSMPSNHSKKNWNTILGGSVYYDVDEDRWYGGVEKDVWEMIRDNE